MTSNDQYKDLIKKAMEAKEKAYVPYSKFHVGAALKTKEGKIYTGCNIESASYTPTICAERTAIAKAISEGDKDFEVIAVTGDSDYTFPCGVCRQVIREFGRDIKVIVANTEDDFRVYTLDELLPNSFGPEDLEENGGRDK
ncbi:cytidine deaminase [Sporosalibacterium faouarense]|uniref:cytidine deaminase n=1 Tax=Sporosalibacterium faouarense TaxID=516123 RepID=UPI00192CDBED|nr:cytidine deaminase [Sporosalibacterium faouarense]